MTVNYIIKEKSSDGTHPAFLVLLYIVIYVILFEFVLPVNYFLPRPLLLGDSLISLQNHYSLLLNILFTVSTVYTAMIAGYFFISFTAGLLIRFNSENKPFIKSLKIFKYFPVPGFAAIFALWIQNSILADLGFAALIAYFYFAFRLKRLMFYIKPEYIDAVKPLGVTNKVISREVIWKSLVPLVLKSLVELNFVLWTLTLVFEYIKGHSGIGYILRMSYEYQDLSGIFVLSIITGLLIFLGSVIINLIQKKIIRWEP